MYALIIIMVVFGFIWLTPALALADYNVSVKEKCYYETMLVQKSNGQYEVVEDTEMTCKSTPDDWGSSDG